jgi:hypothetical protein
MTSYRPVEATFFGAVFIVTLPAIWLRDAGVFCRVPLERLVSLPLVVVVVPYFARSYVIMARAILLSGRAAQAVISWSRSPVI